MPEQIGNVLLDDTYYSGKDLYCDGEVEDTLLSLVKEHKPDELQQVLETNCSWPILYHLSNQRQNIVSWLPFSPGQKILEIGSGCGAITAALLKKECSVTCVELSRKRSLINAYRNREGKGSATVMLGNFQEIEPHLERDYDYVLLIGVLEYARVYLGGEAPFHEMLKLMKAHCKPGGRLVIAIENKYGLKYFAGCKEDHLGTYFSGIEDYADASGNVRTFSKNGLTQMLKDCGITDYHFYYPYPDYKFPAVIYSDDYLPKVGELSNNLRNFDQERLLLFDEKNAFDGVIRDGMFADFSNSFLVVAGERPSPHYVKFSNDRQERYMLRTEIREREENDGLPDTNDGLSGANGGLPGESRLCAVKIADEPAGSAHIAQMADTYGRLREKYEGSGLFVNPGILKEEITFPYVQGKTLEEVLDDAIYQNDTEQVRQLLEKFRDIAGYREDTAPYCVDLIFSNIIIEKDSGRWTLIDYEWITEEARSGTETARRAMFVYLLGPALRRKWLFENGIAQSFGVAPDNLEELQKEELRFQREVLGSRLSLYELYEKMGQPVKDIQAVAADAMALTGGHRFQVYEDTGNGFSEAQSRFVEDAYGNAETISLRYEFGSDVKSLRLDPAVSACLLCDTVFLLNGKRIDTERITANGILLRDGEPVCLPGHGRQKRAFFRRIKGNAAGRNSGNGVYLFADGDPNLTLLLQGMPLGEKNLLEFRAGIQMLSGNITRQLVKSMSLYE